MPCSYCRRNGHNIITCFQKRSDEDRIRQQQEQQSTIDYKVVVKKCNEEIQEKLLTEEDVSLYLENLPITYPFIYLYLWMCIFPNEPVPENSNYLPRLKSYYIECIRNHPQYEKRLKELRTIQMELTEQTNAFNARQKRVTDTRSQIAKIQQTVLNLQQLVYDKHRLVIMEEALLREVETNIQLMKQKRPRLKKFDVEPIKKPETIDMCDICTEEPKNVVLKPCNHAVCGTCFIRIRDTPQATKCPYCRGIVCKVQSHNSEMIDYYNVVPIGSY